ncbi:MAG: hypothetical protein J6T39_03185 [Clostridia bacterium]|nr:hypothetical protein [Clostridia bacterium]
MKTNILTRISTFLLVLVMCVMTLVGCAPNANINLPESTSPVSGNGGLAVQKGEYLYFVNGYKSVSSLSDGNNKGGDKYSAIYRAKLTDDELSYDEDGNLVDCELIIDKICGFEKTALYIFGDYIYYATPNTDKVVSDESISSNFELTDFYKAKLDGSQRTHIYKTNETSDSTKFAFYKVNGVNDVYLALYDGSKLVFVNCTTKAVSTISESISSVAMPAVADYNALNNQISVGASYVYYTRSGNDDESLSSGNVFCAAKIGENKEIVLASGVNTYTVKSANNDAIVFTKKSGSDLNANNYAIKYAYDADGKIALDLQNGGVRLDATAHDNVLLCTFEDGNCVGMVAKNASNKLAYFNCIADTITILDEELELTPVALNGNYVYAYDSNNSIYQINYKNGAKKLLADANATGDDEIAKPYFEAKKNFSVLGNHIYYFATYTGEDTGYYLNRVSTAIQDNYKTELLGVLQEKHIAAEEE